MAGNLDVKAVIGEFFVVRSDQLKARVQEAEAVAVCCIAWAEAHAALSRRAHEVPDDVSVIEQAKLALAADWSYFVVLEIDQPLVERAGDYADKFALRGYDSIQLAAAFEAARISQSPIFFACFDTRLNKPGKRPGMMYA